MKTLFPAHKTLGLVYPENNRLCIEVAIKSYPLTRRGLLSVMASVYDPLGMIGPYMLPAKFLLQQLVDKDLDWDNEISEENRLLCKKWLIALPCPSGISILRVYENFSGAESVEMHCFCNANCDGYGAFCYFRILENNMYKCSFIIGKSRAALAKRLSTPRLKLCSAVVAVHLSKVVEREHDVPIGRIIFWSDSTTVLAYLQDTSKQ